MASATRRQVISINDYPEHLNPFHEDSSYSKTRFWTIGRKSRTNSFNLSSGLKDFRNTWSLKSFMKKGKKKDDIKKTPSLQVNGESSPIIYRRPMELSAASQTGGGSRSTIGSPERYIYGGSVTPLPRSRFQARLRSTSQQEVGNFSRGAERASFSYNPGLQRAELNSSRFSVESTNPFDDPPEAPVRASRRKKKRAPAPPSASNSLIINSSQLDSSAVSEESRNNSTTNYDEKEENIDSSTLTIELKIVEDIDVNHRNSDTSANQKNSKEEEEKTRLIQEIDILRKEITEDKETSPKDTPKTEDKTVVEDKVVVEDKPVTKVEVKPTVEEIAKAEKLLSKSNDLFKKVDIKQYRRNSSLNEDDVQLRKAHFEDTTPFKRSKSMTNEVLTNGNVYVATEIPLHINEPEKDHNDNETEQPKKVVCKVYNNSSRKQSLDNSISSTEKEFMEIDKATRQLEEEIKTLNRNLSYENDGSRQVSWTVSDIKMRFENGNIPKSPNPIPKPRRSHYGSSSPINGNAS